MSADKLSMYLQASLIVWTPGGALLNRPCMLCGSNKRHSRFENPRI